MIAGRPYPPYEPVWFKQESEKVTGVLGYVYQGRYWECKEKQDWSPCPNIYWAEAIIKDQSQLFYVTIEMRLYFCLKNFLCVCKAGNLFGKKNQFGSNLFYSWWIKLLSRSAALVNWENDPVLIMILFYARKK